MSKPGGRNDLIGNEVIGLLVVRERRPAILNQVLRFLGARVNNGLIVFEIFLRKLLSAVHNLPQTSCWGLKQKGLGMQLW